MADSQNIPTNSHPHSSASLEDENLQIKAGEIAKLQATLEGVGEGIKNLGGAASEIKTVVKDLNSKMVKYAADSKTSKEEEAGEEESGKERDLIFTKTVNSRVRRCNFEAFMSRKAPNETIDAIEALILNRSFKEEQEKWVAKHAKIELDFLNRTTMQQRRPQLDPHQACEGPSKGVEEGWIQQIRINSEAVLKALSRVSGGPVSAHPVTFPRPFRFLIHFHEQMKEEFEKLRTMSEEDASKEGNVPAKETTKEKRGDADTDTDQVGPGSGASSSQQTRSSSTLGTDESDIRQAALAELRCYIDFVDDSLLPRLRELRSPNLSAECKVRFDDLWYLFKIGEQIFIPKTSGKLGTSSFQIIWRLYRFRLASVYQRVVSGCTCDTCKEAKVKADLTISCYYIDFNGESYQAVQKSLTIERFEGFREIKELPFYPLRCVENHVSMLQKAQEDGAKYIDWIQRRYGFYSGWTLIESPSGEFLKDEKDEKVLTSSHIQSDIVVDFSEALNAFPLWKPRFEQVESTSSRAETELERTLMKLYPSAESPDLPKTLRTKYLDSDGIDHLELNTMLAKDAYLAGKDEPIPVPAGQDLALLPRRLFAYALWARRFIHIDVRGVKARRDNSNGADEKQDDDNAWERLQIDPSNKRLISSMIDSHFQEEAMIQSGIELEGMDFIAGKGKGVGKSITAIYASKFLAYRRASHPPTRSSWRRQNGYRRGSGATMGKTAIPHHMWRSWCHTSGCANGVGKYFQTGPSVGLCTPVGRSRRLHHSKGEA